MTVTPPHAWLLTAPWWHWPRQDVPPEETRPALQKYATPELVDEFLADPQRRLVFDATADHTLPPSHDPATLLPLKQGDDRITKLYLTTHHRHYLVTVELHCAAPGLPGPDRADVCEAGFVVRRRRATIEPGNAREARRRINGVSVARARVGVIERRLRQAARAGRVGEARFTALADQHAAALRTLHDRQAEVHDWAQTAGIERSLEGWHPLAVNAWDHLVPLPERPCRELRPLPRLGRWLPVAEVPDTVAEGGFPLYPLVPDPREPDHDAAGRVIWFGVVPTTAFDAQLLAPPAKDDVSTRIDRAPRFDDLSVYEIRCFVRRHDPGCPRKPGERDCRGPLTWSEPSEAYRLAAPLDARGTAHRPVTVRLPSKAELAEGAKLGAGMGGIRIASPDINLDPGGGDGFQICSFGIPLITIVATFVLKLFLGIVVFLFGLWILLAFKLCIPPSISLSAGVEAQLDLQPPDFEADASFEASLGLDVPGQLSGAGASMQGGFGKAGLAPDPEPDLDKKLRDAPVGDRFRMLRALATHRLSAPDDDLHYEPRVERAEVLVP